jgi:hypothetical protein
LLKSGPKMGEPVKKPILGVGRFAGLNREYSVEYSIGSARLGCGAAWEGNILWNIRQLGWRLGFRRGVNGSNMARVDGTHRLPLARVAARGPTVQNLQVAHVAHRGVRST